MNAIINIYCPQVTSRLRYVLEWILTEQLQVSYRIINSIHEWENCDGILINYSDEISNTDCITIKPSGLLSQDDVRSQSLSVNRWKGNTVLYYNQPGKMISFDIFSAIFFLLSRYEEYLPHKKDIHERYIHTQSVAHQYSFLQQPVIDDWLMIFRKILKEKYHTALPQKGFRWVQTYDIDIAWSYLHKGRKRFTGALLKDISFLNYKTVAERYAVLKGVKKDPYDNFEWLDGLHQKYKLHPIYFFLLGRHSVYDKNIQPKHPAMQQLIKKIAAQYDVGIHPSYLSNADINQLSEEIELLQDTVGKTITSSRQHYIKLSLPSTYCQLLDNGIIHDYSMGYAAANGFRAGTSQSFYWYNLEKNIATKLRVHPFAFMEVTSKVYEKLTVDETFMEWERLYNAVKKTDGTLISIWHNHTLGNDRLYRGWDSLYKKMLMYHFGY